MRCKIHVPHFLAEQAAAAVQNANLYKTTRVDSNNTGVYRAPNSFNLQYEVEDNSGDDDMPPKMELDYDSDDSDDSYRGYHHS